MELRRWLPLLTRALPNMMNCSTTLLNFGFDIVTIRQRLAPKRVWLRAAEDQKSGYQSRTFGVRCSLGQSCHHDSLGSVAIVLLAVGSQ